MHVNRSSHRDYTAARMILIREINRRQREPIMPINPSKPTMSSPEAQAPILSTSEHMINAKREIILKHVNDDGTINWGMNGVAGENDNEVHDHWVDGFGNDVITDFNREEGDKIRIEGHTTEVYNSRPPRQ